jgi:hypothetical protein
MTCSEAQQIMNGTRSGSKLFAGVKIRSECKKGPNGRVVGNENTSGTVAPNQKWSSMGMRSRRNRRHRGGANEGNNTERILAANPSDTPECEAAKAAARAKSGVMRKVGSIKVKQVCSGGAKTVAPNQKWSSMGI